MGEDEITREALKGYGDGEKLNLNINLLYPSLEKQTARDQLTVSRVEPVEK